MKEEYKDIAAYEPEDFKEALHRLTTGESFRKFMGRIMASTQGTTVSAEKAISMMAETNNLDELDYQAIHPALKWLMSQTSASLTLHGEEYIESPALFITNHRDIVLDAALLSLLVKERKRKDLYIGIGTNLYVEPWVEDFMRLHKAFSVIRGGTARELQAHAQCLSGYIRHILHERQGIAWIAQREGRAKDSNDHTQPAVLKMLTLAGEGSFAERLQALHLTPAALCYEYDPCDYLKAQEMQLRRDNPEWKKRPEDDYLNMHTGMTGWKGHIVFTITRPLNETLKGKITAEMPKNEQVTTASQQIDKQIHQNYHIFNTNRIAFDLLHGTHTYAGAYTAAEKKAFEEYIAGQTAKARIPHKDEAFLRERMLEMYANPLINHIRSMEEKA